MYKKRVLFDNYDLSEEQKNNIIEYLYLDCTHHDGTNSYEIKKLTDKGIAYLSNYENNWDGTRSLQYVHDKIMESYSVLPNFAHKVYGLPKREVV